MMEEKLLSGNGMTIKKKSTNWCLSRAPPTILFFIWVLHISIYILIMFELESCLKNKKSLPGLPLI